MTTSATSTPTNAPTSKKTKTNIDLHNLTSEHCQKFVSRPDLHPLTGKKIKIDGPTYETLRQVCEEQYGISPILSREHCESWVKKPLIDPRTSKEIDMNGPEYRHIQDVCLSKYSLKKDALSLQIHNALMGDPLYTKRLLDSIRDEDVDASSIFRSINTSLHHYNSQNVVYLLEYALHTAKIISLLEPLLAIFATSNDSRIISHIDAIFKYGDKMLIDYIITIIVRAKNETEVTHLVNAYGHHLKKNGYMRALLSQATEQGKHTLVGNLSKDISWQEFHDFIDDMKKRGTEDDKTLMDRVRTYFDAVINVRSNAPEDTVITLIDGMLKYGIVPQWDDLIKRVNTMSAPAQKYRHTWLRVLMYIYLHKNKVVTNKALVDECDEDGEYRRITSLSIPDLIKYIMPHLKVDIDQTIDIVNGAETHTLNMVNIVYAKYDITIASLGEMVFFDKNPHKPPPMPPLLFQLLEFDGPNKTNKVITLPQEILSRDNIVVALQYLLDHDKLLYPILPLVPYLNYQNDVIPAKDKIDFRIAKLYLANNHTFVKVDTPISWLSLTMRLTLLIADMIEPAPKHVTSSLKKTSLTLDSKMFKHYRQEYFNHAVNVFKNIEHIRKSVKKSPKSLSPLSPDTIVKTAATNTISAFVKGNMQKLERYYHDSAQYMIGLPKAKRQSLVDSMSGVIMQGPFSPIKRIGTLLFANEKSSKTVLNMIEVLSRAPRLPLRQSMWRGMTIIPSPSVDQVITQVLPFSTSFLSSFAIGWIHAKRNATCCVFQVRCHTGTVGLFASKVPWLEPWSEKNRSIYNHVFNDEVGPIYHPKVNAQNEYIMAPYRLRIRNIRKKNLRTLLESQKELYETHYQYDAIKRGMKQLESDFTDQDIDVYEVDLEPVSVYAVQLNAAAGDEVWAHFSVHNLYSQTGYIPSQKDNYRSTHTIFFSPEETDPSVVKQIQKGCDAGYGTLTKIIEKGRFVGQHTF